MGTHKPAWQEQWHRVRRWHGRIEDMNSRLDEDTPKPVREEYKDFLLAFFQNCWHLKEWIINDPSLSVDEKGKAKLRKKVEGKLKKYNSLMYCADLANRTKHLELTNIRRDAEMKRRKGHVHGNKNGERIRWDFEITDNTGDKIKALALARQAVEDWEKVPQEFGLRVP